MVESADCSNNDARSMNPVEPGLAGPSLAPPEDAALTRAFSQSLKILLAEDNPVNQQVALLYLQMLGYEADVVENGLAVLAALETQTYQVILMDVQMPEMDGITATRCISERYAPPHRPYIIALTASMMPGDRRDCLSAGMRAYLTKPIQKAALLEALQQAQASLAAIAAVAPTVAASHPSPATPTSSSSSPGLPADAPNEVTPVLNLQVIEALQKMAGASATVFLTEIVEEFLADTPTVIAALLAAIAQSDAAGLNQSAHRLRSSSANLGAERLSKLGQTLEQQGRLGLIPDLTESTLKLQTEYDQTKAALLALANAPR